MPEEQLTVDELAHVCFGPGDEIIGDDDGAIAFSSSDFGEAPVGVARARRGASGISGRRARRRRSCARRSTRRASHGARSVHLASAVPRYLWPGVDLANTRAGMLFETLGFERDLVGINMSIPSTSGAIHRPACVVERETGYRRASDFAARAYPHWVDELDGGDRARHGVRGARRRRRDDRLRVPLVNRAAWIGPMATDPDAQHGGVGSAVLAAVCADLDARGHATGEIAWVSNLRFYGKCGATVSRVFQGGHLALT